MMSKGGPWEMSGIWEGGAAELGGGRYNLDKLSCHPITSLHAHLIESLNHQIDNFHEK
jgi:hypothetical protein